ncbi:thiaminase II [Brevibacillus daliensis]|uniref:thiaminase II n=1 Tax=Brevibacillus daliensis TaxID=2892995 RepID=UPI001E4D3ADC|nr:thiaminase II [Brevibacillus daliensis]
MVLSNPEEIKTDRFTDMLYQTATDLWERTHLHPFLTGIADGSLPKSCFQHYMKQDYLFLQQYAKLFALASVKTDRLEWSGLFAALMTSTLTDEMALHRGYAERLGISEQDLLESEPAFVMLAYTSYMLQVAHEGTLGELVSALLPCTWSYREIGKRIAMNPATLQHEFYGEWVSMYSSDEFGSLTDWLRGVLDELAEQAGQEERERMKRHFIITCHMEYQFWDMAYKEQVWP